MHIRLRFTIVLLAMVLLTILIPGYIAYRRTEEVLLGTAKRSVLELIESEKITLELLLQQELLLTQYLTREEEIVALLDGQRAEGSVVAVEWR